MHHRSIIFLLWAVALAAPAFSDVEEKSFREQYYDEETETWNFPPPKSRSQKVQEIEADAVKLLEQYASSSKELDGELLDRLTRNLREANNINNRVPGPGERVIQSDVAAAIEPLREVVYSMTQSGNEVQKYHGVRYLTYLAPTEKSMTLLYSVGESESSEAPIALDAIFQSGWDTRELRLSLVDQLERKADGESKKAGPAGSRGGRWGLVEAVPVYTRLLEQNYYENGHLSPISQLIRLGDAASSALPTIYEIIEDGRIKGSLSERDLYYLRNAVMALGGNWPKENKTAEEIEPVAPAAVEAVEEVTPSEPATEKPAEVKTPDTSREPAEQSSNWWLWLIGALVVFGGIALVVRRKS